MPFQHQKPGIAANLIQLACALRACILMRSFKRGQIEPGKHQPKTSRQECLGANPSIRLALSLA